MKKAGEKTVALALALSMFTLTNAACFGKFELTRKIYQFNEGISGNRFVRTLLMWVLIIFQIYTVGGLLDLWIFNLVECFTGSNPLARLDDGSLMVASGDTKAVISRAGNQIKIDFYERDAYTGSTRVTMDDKGVVHAAGRLGSEGEFSATYQGGILVINDKNGTETLSGDEIRDRVAASGFTVPIL